ncbi:YbhB/YbcL family Raf kinase inhibitor-like protein [Providencia stuartii]|uniref:YbhB/YbcL family Raf kinase inhibitor-like protein n=1 Tax=Providencia TaxID=586 RepID=UPI00073CB1D3|nr:MULTISPECIES: YbhB/YbcL family Raf kinase inhibitor-like protein [Providencia]SST03864.1 putative kinase inhibitor [Acinetobacter baumannii]KSX92902.1 kinase inhibitor [Providencia stuartii]MCX3069984.1 YbhB/YbcL family Raf kinase inhibitor-like protein [Providencia stuartii]MDT2015321.1 YbhB/YbcL family Raf kinase inhibitor-like protein [Providencia stuartii]MDT2082819.1 YbhB/YbcL family Raf kinase inhibitor-like protein [Providencia stuartii]
MKLQVVGSNEYAFLSKDNEFNFFGGNGENKSPELSWTDVPGGTKSFAVTVYDPDAPTGSGFWHWIAYDIPHTVRVLPENSGSNIVANKLNMKQAVSDFGQLGYGGCCPPEGGSPHRYIFCVYALSIESLPVTAETSNAVIRYLIHTNTIQKAEFTTLYKR